MPINIEIKVVPFGQVRIEIGKHVSFVEEGQVSPTKEVVRYCEPQETASRIYEVEYGEKPTNYVIPLSTG